MIKKIIDFAYMKKNFRFFRGPLPEFAVLKNLF